MGIQFKSNFVEQTREWEKAAKEAFKYHQLRKKYEELERFSLEKLKIISSHESSRSSKFQFLKYFQKGTIDYTAIPELKFMDLESYRRVSRIAWKLSRIK